MRPRRITRRTSIEAPRQHRRMATFRLDLLNTLRRLRPGPRPASTPTNGGLPRTTLTPHREPLHINMPNTPAQATRLTSANPNM